MIHQVLDDELDFMPGGASKNNDPVAPIAIRATPYKDVRTNVFRLLSG
jgi:hypothetical protein